jgi:hypothetical protein
MYKGYDLKIGNIENTISTTNIEKYISEINKIHELLLNKIQNNFQLVDDNGVIDVTQLKENWFPSQKYDVFISHSHNDQELAIKLAVFLKKTFGLDAFVDSAVWGYSNDLIRNIDNQYCVLKRDNQSGSVISYDYEKRNYSTSQVNLILSSALHDMIDDCECIIFLNTQNSIHLGDTVSQKTNSPWIYDELQTTRIIRRIKPERLFFLEQRDLNKSFDSELTMPMFDHDVTKELKYLTKISEIELNEWKNQWQNRRIYHNSTYQKHSLDILYEMTAKYNQE